MIARKPLAARMPRVGQFRWPSIKPRRDLPLLTIVLLLTSAPDQWYLRAPLVALFALGVVFRSWLVRPQFWYVVATLLGATVYLTWESSDNHKYLFVYWCLALSCAFSLPKPQQEEALALSPVPKVIWMQLTVRHDEAAAKAEAAGIKVVMNRCPKIEYGRLSGEIGWNGVNSRVLSSKKPLMRSGFQSFGVRQK